MTKLMTVEETKILKSEDFIIAMFCHIDDTLKNTYSRHAQGSLYPSELQTLGILFALKGCGEPSCTPAADRTAGTQRLISG